VDEELRKARETIAEKNERLRRLRRQLQKKDEKLAALEALLRARQGGGASSAGVDPANIVWIFGAGRTGSTWLASMMEELDGCAVWREPLVGELFGHLYYVRAWESHHGSEHFILGRYRETWLGSIRSFVQDGANVRFPELANGGYLVVKEPNGSIGAPLLVEALPESRVIFLIRDPRDVAASVLDATREGSWFHERRMKGRDEDLLADINTHPFLREQTGAYAQSLGNARTAYEAHKGPKALVRYEDLRADTLGTLKLTYSTLGMEFDEEGLARAVAKHSWEAVPEEEKGEGKFYRRASPGGWREDLTPEQVEAVEKVAAPLLDEYYPGWRDGDPR
jgi:hypothetical protein